MGAGADFAYGNTRLRARWPTLLDEAFLERLSREDVAGQLAALATGTPYSSDVEAALARATGLVALLLAVRSHLARTLTALPALYDGRARELIELYLAGWDLHNLLVLLRAAVLDRPPAAALEQHVPVGAFTFDAFAELARQADAGQLIALVTAWRLPDSETTAALGSAWPEFERTGNLAALERRLVAAHERRVAEAAAGRAGAPLRRWLAAQADARDVVLGLRVRDALAAGEFDRLPPLAGPDGLLAGGGLANAGRIEAAVRQPEPERVATALERAAPRVPGLRAALAGWVRGAGPSAVQRELDEARERALLSSFRGDALGVSVPLAWAVAKQREARQLRLRATAAVRAVRPHTAREAKAA